MEPVVVVHGGAGRFRFSSDEEKSAYAKALRDAVENGLKAMASGNALDAVTESITSMEYSGLFNAGRGSVLTIGGDVEVDAGIMYGYDMRIGAVAAVKNVVNAIRLARFVMEKTDHVMVVGDGARELAKLWGLYRPTNELYSDQKSRMYGELLSEYSRGLRRFTRVIELAREMGIMDTVGSVAMDKDGNLAAGTSTGGVWLKLSGRVGDSPIPGAGFWAQNGVGAFSASGLGEVIIRLAASIRAAMMVKEGLGIHEALRLIVEEATAKYGTGTIGIVGIDHRGNVASSFNTESMARAVGRLGVVKVAFSLNDPWP